MLTCLALPFAGWWLIFRPLPDRDGVVKFLQLGDSAVVNFDGRGVPYIHATSEQDLYMVQGYVVASDRLFQMDMLRRTAKGELAEVFGPQAIASDRLMRTIGFNRLANDQKQTLSPSVAKAVAAYCQGVNKFIADNNDKLPIEFVLLGYKPKVWQPDDTLAIMKYLDYIQDESWRLDDLRQRVLDRLGAEEASDLFGDTWSSTPTPQMAEKENSIAYLKEALPELAKSAYLHYAPHPNIGSSVWAIASDRTDTHGALLACDKHNKLTKPDLWYIASLSSPGVHVAGATIPGVPGILVGRNEFISWGTTALKADVQDLFLEEFSQQFSDKYRTKNGWKTAYEITEVIPVRFAKSREHKVLITEHGPVLLKNQASAVSLAWTGSWARPASLETYFQINRAQTISDCQLALEAYAGSPMNFLFADKQGAVASQAAGIIPVRDKGGQGTLIVSGAGEVGQWSSTIPYKALPAITNPKQRFLVSANQKLVSQSYPWLIGHQFLPPYRAWRAFSLIGQNGRRANSAPIGLPDVNEIQGDMQAPLFELVRNELHQAVEDNHVIDKNVLSALNLLGNWDGQMRAESPEAAIYESFIYTLGHRIIENKLGRELAGEYFQNWPMWVCFVEHYMHGKQEKWLPKEERTYSTFIITSLTEAMKNLRVACNTSEPDKWDWKNLHKVSFQNAINQGLNWPSRIFNLMPLGVGGDDNCLNALSCDYAANKDLFACTYGPDMRLLVDMSDADKFYQSLSCGQSGQFLSSHEQDEINAWLRVDPMPVAFSAKQVDHQSEHKLILVNHI